MAASLVLTIKTETSQAALAQDSSADQEGMAGIVNYLNACRQGMENASIDIQYNATAYPVAASATATCASVAADDTITIGAVTLTAKASPANENQFSQAGSDTADAASLVSVINAHSVLSKVVFASSLAGVVTVTWLMKGVGGNQVGFVSSNGTRLAVTGSGFLAGGTGGATTVAKTYSMGL